MQDRNDPRCNQRTKRDRALTAAIQRCEERMFAAKKRRDQQSYFSYLRQRNALKRQWRSTRKESTK